MFQCVSRGIQRFCWNLSNVSLLIHLTQQVDKNHCLADSAVEFEWSLEWGLVHCSSSSCSAALGVLHLHLQQVGRLAAIGALVLLGFQRSAARPAQSLEEPTIWKAAPPPLTHCFSGCRVLVRSSPHSSCVLVRPYF